MNIYHVIVSGLAVLLLSTQVNAMEDTNNLNKLLFDAVRDDRDERVQDLIRQGASVRARKGGYLPLHEAAQTQKSWVVYRLLEADPSTVNERAPWGETALHFAAHMGYDELVDLLLQNGADVHAKTLNNETPLHYSLSEGRTRSLLAYGADIHAQDCHGHTPLHFRLLPNIMSINMYHGKSRDAEIELVRRGANPFLKDFKGITALDSMDTERLSTRSRQKKLLEEWRHRCAIILLAIQKAADPTTELLDPEKPRMFKLPAVVIEALFQQIYPGSKWTSLKNSD